MNENTAKPANTSRLESLTEIRVQRPFEHVARVAFGAHHYFLYGPEAGTSVSVIFKNVAIEGKEGERQRTQWIVWTLRGPWGSTRRIERKLEEFREEHRELFEQFQLEAAVALGHINGVAALKDYWRGRVEPYPEANEA